MNIRRGHIWMVSLHYVVFYALWDNSMMNIRNHIDRTCMASAQYVSFYARSSDLIEYMKIHTDHSDKVSHQYDVFYALWGS